MRIFLEFIFPPGKPGISSLRNFMKFFFVKKKILNLLLPHTPGKSVKKSAGNLLEFHFSKVLTTLLFVTLPSGGFSWLAGTPINQSTKSILSSVTGFLRQWEENRFWTKKGKYITVPSPGIRPRCILPKFFPKKLRRTQFYHESVMIETQKVNGHCWWKLVSPDSSGIKWWYIVVISIGVEKIFRPNMSYKMDRILAIE